MQIPPSIKNRINPNASYEHCIEDDLREAIEKVLREGRERTILVLEGPWIDVEKMDPDQQHASDFSQVLSARSMGRVRGGTEKTLQQIEFAFDQNGRIRVLFGSLEDYKIRREERPVLWDSETGLSGSGEQIDVDLRTAIEYQILEVTGLLNQQSAKDEAKAHQPNLRSINEASLAGKVVWLRPPRTVS